MGTSELDRDKDEVKSEIRAILFMDVSGWSKLEAHQIASYVQNVLPKLKVHVGNADFYNTWGDAIVATYKSAVDAARAALDIRDFFIRSTPSQGVPDGLTCRIALHQGEVLLCKNALMDRIDVFGAAVHLAARLEPATAPSYVFCTPEIASSLAGVKGTGPKTFFLGAVDLPKGYGTVNASVVVHHNVSDDPTPNLQSYKATQKPDPHTA